MLPSSFKLAAALQLWLGYLRLGEAAAIEKRLVTTDTSDFTLYAYGTNISGLPVFFGDSYAYVGYGTPSGISTASNLTFTLTDGSLGATKNTTAGGSSNFTGPQTLYIDTSTGASSRTGFVAENDTTTLTTTNFALYGGDLQYNDDGTLMSNFWATTTDSDNIWSLIWNQDGAVVADSTPVVVTTSSPAK